MPRRNRPPTTPSSRLVLRKHADIEVMRAIMDLACMWSVCYRACRRRKSCASPTVRCFDHNLERVRKFTADLADWPRLDGPRDPDDLLEPADDPFD
jgi:hypothetical protein